VISDKLIQLVHAFSQKRSQVFRSNIPCKIILRGSLYMSTIMSEIMYNHGKQLLYVPTFLSLAICSISSNVDSESFPRTWSFSEYPRWQSVAKVKVQKLCRSSKQLSREIHFCDILHTFTCFYSPTRTDIVFSGSASDLPSQNIWSIR